MAKDPKKVAPRTLFQTERDKAERKYKRVADKIKKMMQMLISSSRSVNEAKARLRRLADSREFREFCNEQARQIVSMLAVGEKRSWREAASASSNGRKIYQALMKEFKTRGIGAEIDKIVEQNAKLIRTCPIEISEQLSRMAAKRQFEGMRPEEITKEVLEKAPHLTEAQARRIARTESAKAATALIEVRAEALGLDFYIWKTCHDERVRKSHKEMDGVVCRWDDPPDPENLAGEKSAGSYPPGGIYNCRCIPAPVVDEHDLHFPVKVHISGSIKKIDNLKDFKAAFGMPDSEDDRLYARKRK